MMLDIGMEKGQGEMAHFLFELWFDCVTQFCFPLVLVYRSGETYSMMWLGFKLIHQGQVTYVINPSDWTFLKYHYLNSLFKNDEHLKKVKLAKLLYYF